MRFRLALNLALVGVCLVVMVDQFGSVWRQARANVRPDPVERFERRLGPLRPYLAEVPAVGCLPLPDGESIEDTSRLFLTQYVLAPTLVQETSTPHLAVGQFRSASEQAAYISSQPVHVVVDLGGGVVLLERRDR